MVSEPPPAPRRLCTCCDHYPVLPDAPICLSCQKVDCQAYGFCLLQQADRLDAQAAARAATPLEPMIRQPEDTL